MAEDAQGPAVLTGWGRRSAVATEVRSVAATAPTAYDDAVVAQVRAAPARGLVARGLGRSYNDAAQNAGGAVLRMAGSAGVGEMSLDPDTATGDVPAGASVGEVLRWALPQGYFLPVVPGTRQVTLGGAVAADVHGKNHHRDGSLGNHLLGFRLVDGTGAVRDVDEAGDRDLWRATIGGLGLTGVLTRVRLRLLPVRSDRVAVRTERGADLEEVMARLAELDRTARYSVAWVDGGVRRHGGRGVVSSGDHADPSPGDSGGAGRQPRSASTGGSGGRGVPSPSVPRGTPALVGSAWLQRALNEAWFQRAPRRPRTDLVDAHSFFFPLDGVSDWNRAYGRSGFVQYQFVVPDEAAEAVGASLRLLEDAGEVVTLAVLKRMGRQGDGLLSFPRPGWTLALDVPVGPTTADALRRLDELVLAAGGRVYLAKDGRCAPRAVARMYPLLREFLAVCDRVDPHRVFRSDLARRLGWRDGGSGPVTDAEGGAAQ